MSHQIVPWETLGQLIEEGNNSAIVGFLENLSASETARVISRLSDTDRNKLIALLSPEDAADIIEDISETQAADIVENIPTEQAAAIMDELDSDHLADVLGEMETEKSESILLKMEKEEAEEARVLLSYKPDVAGGLMVSEFLTYHTDDTIRDVLADLQDNQEKYKEYNVQYFYVLDQNDRFVGVLRMHDLLFPAKKTRLEEIMIQSSLSVSDQTTLLELKDFFDEHKFFGVPVVNEQQYLVGVVLPQSVEEEVNRQRTKAYLRLSGIIGGEEYRTMPLKVRSGRRLTWLSMNIVLNIIAASVIAMYQDTLAAVITLAVFLPMVSDMSGCSGNQAVAVSMRELSLGLVKPREILWVILKETRVGIVNGIILGGLLGFAAFLWQGNMWLGVVVGGALAANTLVSVIIGGALPLILKRIKVDPALVSSPLLTTVTDMCGFFFVLSFASALLPKLSGM